MPGAGDSGDATAVARWMLEEVWRKGFLSQYEAAPEIADRFGEHFTYLSAKGTLAIDRRVLSAFRKLSGESVVWSDAGKFWRLRKGEDSPGRKQP